MPRKPIVPIFAGAPTAPAMPLFAGGETKVDHSLPLAPERIGLGMEWHLVVGFVLLLLILVAYGNSFQSEWVLDNKYIIELDPRTKSVQWDDVAGKPGVRNIFTQDYWWPKGISGLYRPITSFTYWLNWTVFKNGHNPTPREQVIGFHWVNLGIHFLNAFLFYRLMLRLTKRFWVSFFAAAIFAMHPVAVESVTNIIGLADMFAATAVLGGMLLYIDVQRNLGAKRVLWLTALMLLTIFGMFSKESTIAVGLVIVAYDLIYRVGQRLQEYAIREGMLALTRLVLILPLFFCAVRMYVNHVVPWLGTLQTGSTGYVFALIGVYLALGGLFFSMALLATRNIWIYAPVLLLSAVMLDAFGSLYQPQVGYSIFVPVCALAFVAAEVAFMTIWPEQPESAEERATSWKGFFDGYYVLLPALLLMLGVRHWVFENTTPAEEPFLDNPLRGLPFIGSRMTAFKVWWLLLWKLIWPSHLSSDYSYNEIPMFGFHGVSMAQDLACVATMLLFFGVLAIAVWAWWKGQKGIAFFILLYFINYVPTGNFLFIIGSIMAERFMYLPLLGFSACVVIGVDLLARKFVGALDEGDTSVLARDGTRGPDFDKLSPKEGPGIVSQVMPYRYLPHVVLGVLIVIYGVRAFYRNYVWHTDVTLWTNAQVKSPKSFRSYQSLAFALFEQDAVGNCDRMIDIDEQGLTIVDDLPNPNNSSRLYLHLGMYYSLKGDILSKQDPQRGLIVTEAARPWLEKSAGILERGMPIDRAFNEVNRGRDVKRGRNGEDTPDVGLAPVYGYLGDSYKRLGSCELYTRDFRLKLLDQAERTFRYMRHLEPTDADAYFKMASLQVYIAQVTNDRPKLEQAAVSLMQCILLDANNQNAWQLLNEIFKQLNTDPYPCIVVNSDGRAQLDLSRSLVHTTVLDAYREFVKIFLMAKRVKLAESARDTAMNQYHFDRKVYFDPLFDPTYLKQFGVPVPPDPMFYHPKPVKFELMMPEVKKAFKDATGKKDIEELHLDIVDGRAQYWVDTMVEGKMCRVRVSEEGKLLSKDPVSAR